MYVVYIVVNDAIRDRDHDDRVWKYQFVPSMCTDMNNCDFELSSDTDSSSDDDVTMFTQMEWHDASVWQGLGGPQWTDEEGNSPDGVPTEGASVIIPEG